MINRFPLKSLHIYVAISLAIFGLIQSLKFYSVSKPAWVFSYLNDFLIIPMVATICLHAVWFINKDKSVRLNAFTIISLVLLFSLYFESYLPMKSSRFTGDVWDVICYCFGGFLFYILQSESTKKAI